MPGIKNARRACRFVLPNAASPAEIALTLYLGLPRMLGGHGLLPESLNHSISLGRFAGVLTDRRRLVADLYWPAACLDVEYKSTKYHLTRKAMTQDAEREAALSCVGIEVIDVTWEQLASVKGMERAARSVSKHLGKRFCPKSDKEATAELFMRTKLLHYLRTLRFEQAGLYETDDALPGRF